MRIPASCAKYSYSCRIHRNTAGGRRLLDSTSTNNDWSFKLTPSATYNHLPLFGVTRLQKVTTLKVASQTLTASVLLYPQSACSTWVLSSAKIVIALSRIGLRCLAETFLHSHPSHHYYGTSLVSQPSNAFPLRDPLHSDGPRLAL